MHLSDVAISGDLHVFEQYLKSENLRILAMPAHSISRKHPLVIYRLMWDSERPFLVTNSGADQTQQRHYPEVLVRLHANCPDVDTGVAFIISATWRIEILPDVQEVIEQILTVLHTSRGMMDAPHTTRGPFLVEMVALLKKLNPIIGDKLKFLGTIISDPKYDAGDSELGHVRSLARVLEHLSSNRMTGTEDGRLQFNFPILYCDLSRTHLYGYSREKIPGMIVTPSVVGASKVVPHVLPDKEWFIDQLIESTPDADTLPSPDVT